MLLTEVHGFASSLQVSTINLPYALRACSAEASHEQMVLYIYEIVKHGGRQYPMSALHQAATWNRESLIIP